MMRSRSVGGESLIHNGSCGPATKPWMILELTTLNVYTYTVCAPRNYLTMGLLTHTHTHISNFMDFLLNMVTSGLFWGTRDPWLPGSLLGCGMIWRTNIISLMSYQNDCNSRYHHRSRYQHHKHNHFPLVITVNRK